MKEVKGIWLPDDDTHFKEHLLRGEVVDEKGTYQYKKIMLALKQVPEDHRSLALDIGAHVGLWSRILAMHFLLVRAFEPVPALLECFRRNTKDLSNVQVFPMALCSKGSKSSIRMVEVPGNSGNAHVASKDEVRKGKGTFQNVQAQPLDNIKFSFPVDFIKIDVEGYELEVLRGAEETIRKNKPVIVLEQKRGNAERYGWGQHEALRFVLGLGYEQAFEVSGDHCVRPK